MTSKFEIIADALEAMHQEVLAEKGKREAEKLGSKGLVAAFRLAAKHHTSTGELKSFVENAPKKSAYVNRLEAKLKFLRVRASTIEHIRASMGEAMAVRDPKAAADAAWDHFVHNRL